MQVSSLFVLCFIVSRDLIDQAYKEKRVLLTRDAKLLRHEYLIKNQIYRVKGLLKNEQLVEVYLCFYSNRYKTASSCYICRAYYSVNINK